MKWVTKPDERLLVRLASLRETFATTLVGRWSTVQGTFGTLAGEAWEFRPDGTLVVVSRSVMCGEERDVYTWRQDGAFRVALGFLPDEDPDDPTEMRVVEYAFDVIAHDAGSDVVLHSAGATGFAFSEAPLCAVL